MKFLDKPLQSSRRPSDGITRDQIAPNSWWLKFSKSIQPATLRETLGKPLQNLYSEKKEN